MFRKIINSIPNTITCLNLLAGCVAIIFAFKATQTVGNLQGWQWTCVCIGAAALFDFCDGAAARLLKAYSKIGAELDSLADLVSFGVAPAMMIFNLMSHHGQYPWLAYSALAVPVFGALRLARFNVMDVGSTTFRGLPIPSGAIFLMGLAGWIDRYGYPGSAVVALACVITGLAMVGRFEMFSLKFKNFSIHENLRRYVLLAAALMFIVMYGLAGLAWTILFYVLLSVLSRRHNRAA